MCVRVDLPVVSLRLTVNDDAQTTVISEYDKVTFICSSLSSPAVHTWKYANITVSSIQHFLACS